MSHQENIQTWEIPDEDDKPIQEVLVDVQPDLASFPAIGKDNLYYFDTAGNQVYTWDGAAYIIYESFVGHRPPRPPAH